MADSPILGPSIVKLALDLDAESQANLRTHTKVTQGQDGKIIYNTWSSAFSVYIDPEIIEHGKILQGKTHHAASLLVFKVSAKPTDVDRPIKELTITWTFEKQDDPQFKLDAPHVENAAPGFDVPLLIDYTQVVKSKTVTKGLSGKIEGGAPGLASASLTATLEQQNKGPERKSEFSATINAINMPSDEERHGRRNQLQVVSTSNPDKPKGGVPPEMYVAILLDRVDDADFFCKIKADVEIDKTEAIKNLYGIWTNRSRWYRVKTKPKDDENGVKPEGSELDRHLKVGLKKLVRVRTEELYDPVNYRDDT